MKAAETEIDVRKTEVRKMVGRFQAASDVKRIN
jgi:hypothetical protein